MNFLAPINGPLVASPPRILVIPTLQHVIDTGQQEYLRDLDFRHLSTQFQALTQLHPSWAQLQPNIQALREARHGGTGTSCGPQHKASLLVYLLKEMDTSGPFLTGGIHDSLATYLVRYLPDELIVYAPRPAGEMPAEPDTFIAVFDPDTRVIYRPVLRPLLRRIRDFVRQSRRLSRNRK